MSSSNVCPACGAANGPTNAFCINCGTRLGAPPAAVPTAPPVSYPPVAAPPYPSYPAAYPYFPGPPRRTAKFSDLLSGMFEVWSKNFVNFFVVYLALALVTSGLGALLAYALLGTFAAGSGIIPGTPTGGIGSIDIVRLVVFAFASIVLSVVLSSIVAGGMTEYAVRRFRGESMTLQQALRRGLERFLSVLGAEILLALIVFALILLPLLLVFAVILAAGTSGAGLVAAILGLCLALVVGGVVAIYVLLATFVYVPAIMMENASAVGGLTRSWKITKGHMWSLFGAIILAEILVIIITVAIQLPAAFANHPAATIAATALASGIVGSWLVILAAVAYDLIVRQPASLFGQAPPYYPSMAPPPGAAQMPQPPAGAPPPAVPPPTQPPSP